MGHAIYLASFALATLGSGTSGATDDGPILAVELSADHGEYLLGDPVDLHVIVRNVSDQTIQSLQLFVKDVSPQIPLFISEEDKAFFKYRIGLYETVSQFGRVDMLAPREERGYPLRVLYTYERPSWLALEQPGTYFLKVRYRVQISKPSPQVAEFESNTVRIEIKKPLGFDAQLWDDVLNTKQFIQFLHSGDVAPGFPEILDKAIDIVRRFPTTTYAGALRDALREYYRLHEGRWDKSPRTRQELRELLQIDDALFPDDKRLDVIMVYDFRQPTPLRKFLAELSDRYEVPLSLAPEAREFHFRAYAQRNSLRAFMQSQARYYGFVWARRGEGYELTTEEKAYALRLRETEARRAAAKDDE